MKVDFKNKIIEIESGDTFKDLEATVKAHNLEEFEIRIVFEQTYYPVFPTNPCPICRPDIYPLGPITTY